MSNIVSADTHPIHDRELPWPPIRDLSTTQGNGALRITQGKTGKKLRIEVTSELAAVIARMQERPRKATGLSLIQDEKGQRLSYFALRSRFDKAREAAGVSFQFRDIRAKAATDAEDLQYAQKLLGHKHQTMTQHYTRNRKGEKVRPLR